MKKYLLGGLCVLLVVIGLLSWKVVNLKSQLNEALLKRNLLGGSLASEANIIYAPTYTTTSTNTGSGGLPVKLLARGSDRRNATIQNNGSADVYIYIADFASDVAASTTVKINNGFLLKPAGSYEILPENMFMDDIWAATTSVAQSILIVTK